MPKPGRSSAASLSVVSPFPEPPPEPPAHLSEGAKKAWIELFTVVKVHQMVGAWHLCESYATCVALMRDYAQSIDATPSGKLRDELARSFRATATTVAMLGRQLRLSPRSRIDKRVTLKVTPPGKKPWEIEAPPDVS